MNTQKLNLNKMGLMPLSKFETQEIEGGDVDGLMWGKGVNTDWLDTLANGVSALANGISAGYNAATNAIKQFVN